jgi:ABC-2 type transport system permease protein
VNFMRALALARKETIQIWRDPRALLIILTMPFLLMALLGYGVNLDQNHTPLCIFDREGNQQSQNLLKLFASNQYFEARQSLSSYEDLIDSLDAGRCTLGLVISNTFSKGLHQGRELGVQGLVDATNNNTANLITGYARQVIEGYSDSVQADYLRLHGITSGLQPISFEVRTWFNDDLDSRNYVVPGVVAIVMAVIGTFLTSLTIARERERGTMEQLLSAPVSPLELICGKIAPFFVIGMIDALICIGLTIWWFEVPFRGNFALLLSATALFLMTVLLMGLLISTMAHNQFAASQFAVLLTFLPSYLLSGFVFPIDQMPRWLQMVSHTVPARYYVTALKGIFLKGVGLNVIGGQLAALTLCSLTFFFLTLYSFRKTLD